jgi:hypothetical protein
VAAGAHPAALSRTLARVAVGILTLVALARFARADELLPRERSRLGPWQLEMNVVLGLEHVDRSNAVAFGTSAELLWKCTVGVFAGVLSSKGNAVLAEVDNGSVLPAPGDRISIPFGLAVHPFGYLGLRAGSGVRGWGQRLAAGLGIQIGPSVEHIRTSGDSTTVAGLHLAFAADVPLWGGPVEGGVALRLMGRLIAAPSVSLESGAVQMPTASGQFYAGLAWTL